MGQPLDLGFSLLSCGKGAPAVGAAPAGIPAAAALTETRGVSLCPSAEWLYTEGRVCVVPIFFLRFASLGRGMASALPGHETRPGFSTARAGGTGAACSARTPEKKRLRGAGLGEAPDVRVSWRVPTER